MLLFGLFTINVILRCAPEDALTSGGGVSFFTQKNELAQSPVPIGCNNAATVLITANFYQVYMLEYRVVISLPHPHTAWDPQRPPWEACVAGVARTHDTLQA